ncbi:MAG: LemA family protein [Firmicutes bacterium]|nr:LemA family protein [Bacillota bacterium]
MKRGTIVLLVVLGVIAILVLGVISGYNKLVDLETEVDAKWAQVENVLQRRADLIPNLVETVKGYASHEHEIFTEIANARGRLLGARTPEEQIEANQGLDSAIGRLLAISENYPALKADGSFIRLQDELASTENKIATERMRYNEAVRDWNRTIKQFPTVLLASLFGKEARAYFEASEGARDVPQVSF